MNCQIIYDKFIESDKINTIYSDDNITFFEKTVFPTDKVIYQSRANCFVFNLNDENFAITCSHCIDNKNKDIKYKIILQNKKILYANILFDLHHLDISILKLDYVDEKLGLDLEEYMINDVKNDVNDYTPELDIYIDAFNIKIPIINHTKTYGIPNSFIHPVIPTVNIIIDYEDDMHGLSGAIVKSDDIYIGILSNCLDGRTIECIYFPYIMVLIKNMIVNNLTVINTIFFKSTCIVNGEMNGENKYGLYFDKFLKCNYKNKTKTFYFKLGDIVLEIDTKSITENGEIFCDELCDTLNINSFLLLYFTKYSNIDFLIHRTNKINTFTKKFNLIPRRINDILNINLTHQDIYINYKDYIFFELSEDYLKKNFRNNQLQYLLPILDKISHNCNRLIVLDSKTIKGPDELLLNKNKLNIIKSINKEKTIQNIYHLNDLLKIKENNSFIFNSLDNKINIIKCIF